MRQIWFIVRVHKLSTEFEIRIVSQNSTQVFTFVNSLVLCYEAKRFCLYEDNSEKPDDADRFTTQFSHWNRTYTQNIKHAFKQNLFIPGCSCTTWECVIQKKLSSLAFNYRKNAISQEKSIYSCHIQGDLPKILFLQWSMYDFLFLWTPCMRIMKIGTLGEKMMLIPNMTVTLLSEQFLTMNLFNAS